MSKKIGLYKDGNGRFIPAYDEDYEQAQKLKAGEVHYFSVKKIRNPRLHRLFFKLLTVGYENQEQYNNFEHYRADVIVEAGYYYETTKDFGVVRTPKSIAYENMDDMEFKELFDRVMDVVTQQLGVPPDVLLREVKS